MKRRELLAASTAVLAPVAPIGPMASAGASTGASAAAPPRVLRYALQSGERGFDPSQLTDLYSRTVTAHIFEGLYGYDHLARPARLKPVTAAGMPDVSADFRSWTFRVKPGIFFADDPAFKGRRRELVAEDYVYSLKRVADPGIGSPLWSDIAELHIKGLAEYRESLRRNGGTFDYDRPIAGLRALDRYTLRIELDHPLPTLLDTLAQGDIYGAVAREVIEAYPGAAMEHPVGTGPFVLKEWRRSSFIALERNPGHRLRFYRDEVQPAADDVEGQAWLTRLGAQRLPMVDRVELAIIEEEQPRWLSFLSGEFNYIERMSAAYLRQAMPGGRLAPGLARQGYQGYRVQGADVTLSVFNMEDPVVGGYTPDKVALRRAIGLASDVRGEILKVRNGNALPAQSLYMPGTTGYEPARHTEMGEQDPARAKALLDLYGYIDRDGDGWREMPDGRPLVIQARTYPGDLYREMDSVWQQGLAAVGLKFEFRSAPYADNEKAARAGNFQVWTLGWSAASPDGHDVLALGLSSNIGSQNYARFSMPAFDALYRRIGELPHGPERSALLDQAARLLLAYMPYKAKVHRIITDLTGPGVMGYRRPPLWDNWWEFIDVEQDKVRPKL
ncbi:MAG: bicyclomycin resistance protein [Paucibacter sp.]|nr:bicyclomycin resistance protein [Roseateles sp.]